MTIDALLRDGIARLTDVGLESAALDARVLLTHCLTIDDIDLLTKGDREVSSDQAALFAQATERRRHFEPVAYITGHKEFMGLDFYVTPAVLIPRADTESVVEGIIEKIVPNLDSVVKPLRILDLCTGSGAIGLSLAKAFPDALVTLSDISDAALEIAGTNARRFGCENVCRKQSDLFEDIDDVYDIIVTNPPYIQSHVIDGLQTDIAAYEPRLALDGGISGYDFYERILDTCDAHLFENGVIICEIGDGQTARLGVMAEARGLVQVLEIPDLTGTIRGLAFCKRN